MRANYVSARCAPNDTPRGHRAAGNEARVAIVTGAGRGIGRAVALELARAGYSLCLAARSREELEETRSQSGLPPERALIVLVDLASEDAPDLLVGAALDCYGRIDVLVNNAGWAPPRTPLLKMRPGDVDRMIAVNLRAPIALTRLAAVAMIRARRRHDRQRRIVGRDQGACGRGGLRRDQGGTNRLHARGVHRDAAERAQARGDRSGTCRHRTDSEQQAARSHRDAVDGRRRRAP